jgi:acetylornithine deacetylase/succinyl-diaminopimelate desuccinylase-like protein
MKKAFALTPVARLLGELVSIPSVNPEGNPGTPRTGEKEIAAFIGTRLKKLGARVRYDEIEPGRPNVLGVFPCKNKPKGRLLFAPHTDTVSVAGMTVPPFEGRIKNGRLYGRGASDTKGTLAAMLIALEKWYGSEGKTSSLEVSLVGLMGEEAGNQGALALAKNCPAYDLVIVGEPTERKIVHAHKGAFWVSVSATGKAVHASAPERGRNAILLMSAFIQKAQPEMEKVLSLQNHPVLGKSTLSLGTIQGGTKTNIVPASCRIEMDFRLVPGMPPAKILSELKKIARSVSPHLKVSALRAAPAMETDLRNPWIAAAALATRGFATAPWFCDAAIFSQRGIPAVACGPGSIKQAHTADEYVSLAELDRGVDCYLGILKKLSALLR